jgi:DNA replication factor GINS
MYRKLYEAWKREKESLDLQPLPKDFYAKVAEYIKSIRKESRMLDNKAVKARLIKIELKNAKKLIEEILKLRFEKILEAMRSGKIVPGNYLTCEEEKIGGKMFPVADYYQSLTKNLLQGNLSKALGERETKKVVVRFLRNVPAIVGVDLKTYGPYQSEDVASLPAENAKILIKQRIAVEVEMS